MRNYVRCWQLGVDLYWLSTEQLHPEKSKDHDEEEEKEK